MSSATMNQTILVAVPSEGPLGMLATVSPHFGKCQCFTVVEIAEGKPQAPIIVDNPAHRDCGAPVELLEAQGVSVLIVSGIGFRPLSECTRLGIKVCTGNGNTVGELVMEYIAGQLSPIDHRGVCNHS